MISFIKLLKWIIFVLLESSIIRNAYTFQDLVINEGNYVISGSKTVSSLTVKAGSNITFNSDTSKLFVKYGSIKLAGDVDKPIHILTKHKKPPFVSKNYIWTIDYQDSQRYEYYPKYLSKNNATYNICGYSGNPATFAKLHCQDLGFYDKQFYTYTRLSFYSGCYSVTCSSYAKTTNQCQFSTRLKFESRRLKITCYRWSLYQGIIGETISDVSISNVITNVGIHLTASYVNKFEYVQASNINANPSILIDTKNKGRKEVNLNSVTVKRGSGSGLFVNFDTKFQLNNIEAIDNEKDGIFIRSPYIDRPTVSQTNYCQLSCSICTSTTIKYPTLLFIDSKCSGTQRKVFKAEQGHLFTIKVFGSNEVNYSIRDGKHDSSPSIVENKYSKDIDDYYQTKGEFININVKDIQENQEFFIYLESFKGSTNFSFIQNSRFNGNRHGLNIDFFKLPIIMKDVKCMNNRENGINLKYTYGLTNLRDVEVNNNRNGLEVFGCCSQFIIEHSKFISNEEESAFVHFSRSSDDKGIIQTFFYDNTFENQITKQTIKTLKEIDLRIERNVFRNVPGVLNFDGNVAHLTAKVYILKNQFIPNEAGNYVLTISKSTNIKIIDNYMSNCKGGLATIVHREDYRLGLIIRDNKVYNCSMADSLLTIDVDKSQGIFGTVIEKNQFVDNYIESELQLNFPHYVYATVKITSRFVFKIRKNTFINPRVSFEFKFSEGMSHGAIHDLSNNYWGNLNVWERVMGDHMFYKFSKIIVNPRYMDSQLTILKNEDFYKFHKNGKLGGDISEDVVLKKGTYEMKSITRIKRGSKVTIEDGVKIIAWPYTGIEVYGKLDILGKKQDGVVMNMLGNKFNQDRINTDRSSVSTFKVNSTYYKVCLRPKEPKYGLKELSTEDMNMLNAVCQSGAYIGYKSHNKYRVWKKDESKIGAIIECSKPDFNFCTVDTGPCELFVSITCDKRSWGGLSFLANSQPSTIEGLSILNAGLLGYCLYFEFLQHKVKNIYLQSKGEYSLTVHQSWINDKIILENLNITQGKERSHLYQAGKHIEVRNSTFFNAGITIYRSKTASYINDIKERDDIRLVNDNCPDPSLYNIKEGEHIAIQTRLDRKLNKLCSLKFSTDNNLYLKILVYTISGSDNYVIGNVNSQYKVIGLTVNDGTYFYLIKGNTASFQLKNHDYFSSVNYIIVKSISQQEGSNEDISLKSTFKLDNSHFEYSKSLTYPTQSASIICELYKEIDITIEDVVVKEASSCILVSGSLREKSTINVKHSKFIGSEYQKVVHANEFLPSSLGISIEKCEIEGGTIFESKVQVRGVHHNHASLRIIDNNIRCSSPVNIYFYGMHADQTDFLTDILIANNNVFCPKRSYLGFVKSSVFGKMKIINNNVQENFGSLRLSYVDGELEIKNNTFQHHSITSSSLIQISSRLKYKSISGRKIHISENKFDNITCTKTTFLFRIHYTKFTFSSNVITSSASIRSNLFQFLTTGKNLGYNIIGNTIKSNKGLNTIKLMGNLIPYMEKNTFNNWKTEYEIFVGILCQFGNDDTCRFKIPKNFWNSSSPYDRVYHGFNDGVLARLNLSPIFEDSTMKTLVDIEDQVKISNHSYFRGYINEPRVMQGSIEIHGNTIFEDDVIVKPNKTIINIELCSIVWFKSGIQALGEENNPIHIRQTVNGKQYRLFDKFLQVLENNEWYYVKLTSVYRMKFLCQSLCYSGQTKMTSYYKAKGPSTDWVLDCGSAKKLSDCTIIKSYSRYTTYGLFTCYGSKANQIILYNQKKQSTFRNVRISGMEVLSIYGVAPSFENCIIDAGLQGLTFVENDRRKTLHLHNLTIENIHDYGILLVRNENATVSQSKFNRVMNGIGWKDMNNTFTAPVVSNWSLLYFCSAESVHRFEENEAALWTNATWYTSYSHAGCSKVFEAPEGYFIELRGSCINWYCDYASISVFDADNDDILLEEKVISKAFVFRSFKRKIRIEIIRQGRYYTDLLVMPAKDLTKLCTFEKSSCGWENAIEKNSKQSTIFIERKSPKDFGNNLKNDLDNQLTQLGHYLMFHNRPKSQNRQYCYRNLQYGAIGLIKSDWIEAEDNICSFEFFAYEKFPVTYKGQKLEVFAEIGNKYELLKTIRLKEDWTFYKISVWHLRKKRFRIIIKNHFMDYCESFTGIDQTTFNRCDRKDDDVSLQVHSNYFQNCLADCIDIFGNSLEGNQQFSIERNDFSQPLLSAKRLINMEIENGKILIKNLNIHNLKNSIVARIIFNSNSNYGNSYLTFTQNSVSYLGNSTVLTATNMGNRKVLANIERLSVTHSQCNKNFINITSNMAVDMKNNFFYENNVEDNIILIQSISTIKMRDCTYIFNKNTSSFSQPIAIKVESSNTDVQNNIFNNPLLPYELHSTVKSSSLYNFQKNWWGSTKLEEIYKRIISIQKPLGLDNITIEPILNEPPPTSPGIIGCPTGWFLIKNSCYYFYSGVGTFDKGLNWCLNHDGFLINQTTLDTTEALQDVLKYRDLTGNVKMTEIWTTTDDISVNGDLLKPWICTLPFVTYCPFNCFSRGKCVGGSCVCNDGWTGEFCSQFDCKDISECSQRGICIGPNKCLCDPNWYGSNCGSSKCPRYTSCYQCTNNEGCGWCDSTQTCQPGNAIRSESSCENWFYWNCISVSTTSACSAEIRNIGCVEQFCNSANEDSTTGLCEQCKDLEMCYKTSGNNCKIWNEKTCRDGTVSPNLYTENRLNSLELEDNVENISDSKIVYRCTSSFDALWENDDRYQVLIIPDTDYQLFPLGSILYSSKSSVMHKVEEEWYSAANYSIILGKWVTVDQILKYGHFGVNVTFKSIISSRFIDYPENDKTLKKFYDSSLLFLDLGNENVIKCSGQRYNYKDKVVWSYYFITKFDGSSKSDILVYRGPNGFLEEIKSFKYTNSDVFIETEIIDCSLYDFNENQTLAFNNISTISSDLNCDYHKTLNRLYYMDRNKFSRKFNKGDFLFGRESAVSVGVVLNSKKLTNNWNLIEVIDLFTISPNMDEITVQDLNNLKKIPLNNPFKESSENTIENKFELKDNINKEDYVLNIQGSVTLLNSIAFELKLSPYDSSLESFNIISNGLVKYNTQFSIVYSESTDKIDQFQNYTVVRGIEKEIPFFVEISGISIPGTIKTGKVLVKPSKTFFGGKTNLNLQTNFYSDYYVETKYSKDKKREISGYGNLYNQSLSSIDGDWLTTGQFDLNIATMSTIKWPDFKVYKQLKLRTNTNNKLERNTNLDSLKSKLKNFKTSSNASSSGFETEVDVDINHKITSTYGYCNGNICKDDKKAISAVLAVKNDFIEGNMKFMESRESMKYNMNGNLLRLASTCKSSGEGDVVEGKCCSCISGGKSTLGWFNTKLKLCLCPCTCDTGKKASSWMLPHDSCSCCSDGSAKPVDNPVFECPCRCKDGTVSSFGPDGCRCSPCPKCPNGEAPKIRSDGSCLCNQLCGVNGVCTTYRSGSNCDQPVCLPERNCNGNGMCTATAKCNSKCTCYPGFTGLACENKVFRKMWGDPHLETLDGRKFNYFGIGQYWGCRSDTLAYQFRFYGYKGTSFIGASSIKLGHSSILTISTRVNVEKSDLPLIRIDGSIVKNLTGMSKRSFDSGRVKLTIFNPQTDSNSDETTLLIFSIDYVNGAFLSVAVSYSPVMKRQYLSFALVPSKSMFNMTSGLCGLMNNNLNDDFTGPDDTVYETSEEFGNSWRMNNVKRSDGGLSKSWSDYKSNFHKDDLMDQSYTDPNFKPIYSLDQFSNSEKNSAARECAEENLKGEEKTNCVFDVLFSKDLSLSHQFHLQLRQCSNECSFHGICFNRKCSCLDGWSGDSCEIGNCENCINGYCSAGFCICFDGYEGSNCERKAVCDEECSPRGVCVGSNKCKCNPGWTSSSCSRKSKCSNQCSNRGICIDDEVCECNLGYNGTTCSSFSCESRNWCSGNGLCIGYDNCLCSLGWEGQSCSVPVCKNQCSGNGLCKYPGVCSCFNGYTGSDCSERIECPLANNCNGHGICDKNLDRCICDYGYDRFDCSRAICAVGCETNGVCVGPSNCQCRQGFKGNNCKEFSCESLNYCSGHGQCTFFNQCTCDKYWFGALCNQVNCIDANNCKINGRCLDRETCVCEKGFTGSNCSIPIKNDTITPQFINSNYTIVVSEYLKTGSYLLKLNLNSPDIRKSVYFSIFDTKIPIAINSKDGVLRTTAKLSPGIYDVTLLVADRNLYNQQSIAKLKLTVLQIKQCPRIRIPEENRILKIGYNTSMGTILTPIKYFTNKEDVLSESDIIKKLTELNSQSSDSFVINSTNIITAKYPLQIGKYKLKLTILDKSDKNCISTVTFSVDVLSQSLNHIYPILTTVVTTVETTVETTAKTTREMTTKLPKISTELLNTQTSPFFDHHSRKVTQNGENIAQTTQYSFETTVYENFTNSFLGTTNDNSSKKTVTFVLIGLGCSLVIICMIIGIVYFIKMRNNLNFLKF
ncbi:DgyrCDS10784 [Dimorphilus gyrociliatus]|uniref:DgyrCDS10784 n=1 Tax=Dimorphilus gyrociliatus TaxID=2664684 RepID=A0A7I8W6C7_9ANNE|nr:DgyrCDS10784 [Dimorphilus gyrociliatus]